METLLPGLSVRLKALRQEKGLKQVEMAAFWNAPKAIIKK